jgi:hypothetical protein
MKGISLPINVIVIIGVVVLVLVAVGFFFLTSAGRQITATQAQAIFSDGCSTLCKEPATSSYLISEHGIGTEYRTDLHTKFAQACVALGYASSEAMSADEAKTCLAACDSCDMVWDNGPIEYG